MLTDVKRSQMMNALELEFEKTGRTHQDYAISYIAELEITNGSNDVKMIEGRDMASLVGVGIESINVASAINRPWWTHSRNLGVQTFSALQGWNTTSFRRYTKELSRPQRITSAQIKKDQGAGSDIESKKLLGIDSRRLATTLQISIATTVPILLANIAQSLSAEELIRMWMKWAQNSERPTRQPWERNTASGVAHSIAIASTDPIPYVSMVMNAAVNDQPSRASFDLTPLALAKVRDVSSYFGKVAQTGDLTYGSERVITGLAPGVRLFTAWTPQQTGIAEVYNVRRLMTRKGEEDLLLPRNRLGSWTANELTPFGNRMVNAAMNEEWAEFLQLNKEAVAVAKKLKKENPQQSVAQSFSSRSPYRRSFAEKLTPDQRKKFLDKLSDSEREKVLDVERKFVKAGNLIGVEINFVSHPKMPKTKSSSSSSKRRPSRKPVSRSLRSGAR